MKIYYAFGIFLFLIVAIVSASELQILGRTQDNIVGLNTPDNVIQSFLDLSDTPSTYGSAGLCLKVNSSLTPPLFFGTCDAGGGGGDITSVIAGTGLTGGGDSGDVTLNLNTTYTDTLYLSTFNSTYDAKISYNTTFNQTLTDSLYSSIIWNYNQTTATFNLYGQFWYNQTTPAIDYYKLNPAGYYNVTTLPPSSDNSSWNQSYANSLYLNRTSEGLYTTTFNLTYHTFSYNQTTPAINDINSRFWNRTQSWNRTQLYNITQINSFNASWTSTFNSTYDAKVSFTTTNIAYLNNTQTFTAPQNFSNNVTHNQRTCYNADCSAYIYYNGSSLIIQG